MTNHVARLYAVALTLIVFFVTWAVVSARPWGPKATVTKDPRLAALERREVRVHRESIRVRRVVKHRYHVYRMRLRERKREIAAIKAANARAAAKVTTVYSSPSWTPSAAPTPAASSAAPPVSVVSTPPVTSTHSS
jgi:hypothetical protein